MKQMSTQEKIEKLSNEIVEFEANPVQKFYGQELGTAKMIRDGRAFRIFIKEVEKAKSGKATLVEMKVFVAIEGKGEFALVRGHTYLPNFVIENKDVYWVLENKIHDKLSGFADGFSIDRQFVPTQYKTYGNYWSEANGKTAEERVSDHLSFLRNFKQRFVDELRLETTILGFMEMIA